jgi:ferredoxin
MGFLNSFRKNTTRQALLTSGEVVPDPARCIQCGICSYNCPIGIDVRLHAWNGAPIHHSDCLTCGECVARCPRGVLRFETTDLFRKETDA